ncbi:MAG: ATP-binding protein [Thermodesulfobacteriota bacterium]|nr:ATP-binding protein [Thermodesulfobacteriota bacterium]
MGNPFYLQEVPVDAPFCDRNRELTELQSYAEAKANVVLFSPRRYGKTSLVKRIQNSLANKGAVTLFADFFGVASVDDVAFRLAKAVFVITHKKELLWKSALRAMKSFRPVLKPDPSGGVSLSVEPSTAGKGGLGLLDETMDSLREFVNTTKSLVHVALDEFQEIATLREALQVEGIMRTHIQQLQASHFFIGSRRRILLGIFNERQRPFFQSAINYPLNLLPSDELVQFIAGQFKKSQRKCTETVARRLASLTGYHPYYSQKLAFFVYELSKTVTEDAVDHGIERLILSERPVFEATLQGLSPHQRLLLQALAKEPTLKLLASGYIQKHGLGSVGGVQHSSRQLEELDLIEKDEEAGGWRLVDPILAVWLRMQMEEKLSQ